MASDAFRRARRRRLVARRVACVLALCLVVALFSFGTLTHGASSSGRGHVRSVSPVEAAALPSPPGPPPPNMGQVWVAAVARDPSPDLATGGVGTSGNRIALTFDDGPDPRTTPLILDTLKERGVEATFFVVGRQVAENPALLQRIVAEGHAVGNHTYDHADMSGLSAGQMRDELRSTQEAVDDALGHHHPMALMRPPYGNPYLEGSAALPQFREVVRGQRLFPVAWTVDPGDYLLGDDADGVVRAVARADAAGREGESDEVVLLHDNQRQTAEALPKIVDYYEGSGRRFAGVDDLLADKYLEP
ncbi:MAG: polysaccharide deacetylase family protein [Actinomycetota bacterium]|nr:polysaccharide deacetylase family protein [Actinomycetota bacterium]